MKRTLSQRRSAKAYGKPIPNHVHGTLSGYYHWGCPCTACHDEMLGYTQRLRARQGKSKSQR